MKNLKYTSLLIMLLMVTAFAIPENGDQQRLAGDSQMMKEILVEMFKADPTINKYFDVNERDANASYLQGYGMIIKAPTLRADHVVMSRILEEKHVNLNGTNATVITTGSDPSLDWDSLQMKNQAIVTDLLKDYIIRYGDLARGLAPGEKIFISYEASLGSMNMPFIVNRGRNSVRVTSSNQPAGSEVDKITVEVKKEDINSYKEGKISEETLNKRIQVNSIKSGNNNVSEFKIFGKILKSVYKDYESGFDFFTDRWSESADFQILEGFGVVYYLDVRGGREWIVAPPVPTIPEIPEIDFDFDFHFDSDGEANEIEEEQLEKAEAARQKAVEARQKAIEAQQKAMKDVQKNMAQWQQEFQQKNNYNKQEMYQDLENKLKETMIEYGRTLRSLAPDEQLMLSLDLSGCRSCDLPDQVKLYVQKTILDDYDQRKISLEQAIAKITVEETE